MKHLFPDLFWKQQWCKPIFLKSCFKSKINKHLLANKVTEINEIKFSLYIINPDQFSGEKSCFFWKRSKNTVGPILDRYDTLCIRMILCALVCTRLHCCQSGMNRMMEKCIWIAPSKHAIQIMDRWLHQIRKNGIHSSRLRVWMHSQSIWKLYKTASTCPFPKWFNWCLKSRIDLKDQSIWL